MSNIYELSSTYQRDQETWTWTLVTDGRVHDGDHTAHTHGNHGHHAWMYSHRSFHMSVANAGGLTRGV